MENLGGKGSQEMSHPDLPVYGPPTAEEASLERERAIRWARNLASERAEVGHVSLRRRWEITNHHYPTSKADGNFTDDQEGNSHWDQALSSDSEDEEFFRRSKIEFRQSTGRAPAEDASTPPEYANRPDNCTENRGTGVEGLGGTAEEEIDSARLGDVHEATTDAQRSPADDTPISSPSENTPSSIAERVDDADGVEPRDGLQPQNGSSAVVIEESLNVLGGIAQTLA